MLLKGVQVFSLIEKAKSFFQPSPIQTLVKGLTIEYDKQNNCYHVSLPDNIVFHGGGVVILKGDGDMILSAPDIHLNPPIVILNDRRIKNGN